MIKVWCTSNTRGTPLLHNLFEFRDTDIGQNCVQLYLMRIILNQSSKTFVYKSSSKIMHNFCLYWGNNPPVKGGGELSPRGRNFLPLVFSEKMPQKKKIIVKPMVELYSCDNLNHIYRFFSFLIKVFKIHLVETSSGRH